MLLNLSAEHNVGFIIQEDIVNGEFKDAFSENKHDFTADRNFKLGSWDYRVFVK